MLNKVGFPVSGSLEEMKATQRLYLDGEWSFPWIVGNGLDNKGQLNLCTSKE